MLKINLQNIYYFLKVAETLNFTQAAKELYVSQPALSKQIRQLEEVIGVPLLKRNTKGVELTEGGKIMFQAWSDITKQTEEAIRQANIANAKQKHKLKVGLLEFGGVIDFIMPLLEQFDEEQEDMEIEYSTFGFTELKEKLRNHELDLIFSFSSEVPKESIGFSYKQLQNLDLNIIVPKKNKFYNREELRVEELKNETFYIFANSYSDEAKQSILTHCERCGFYPARMKYFPNITSLAVALTSGSGVTIGYHVFFHNMEDRLKFFSIPEEIGKHFIVAAWETKKSSKIEILLKYLNEKCCY